ncbi:MAG: hypothetical protein DME65_03800 [Verrucomicrobia bacterium]|nr:MAG: hypothetical protein DME65_03800 [Verrucomicrobiota bacterium]
MNRIVFTSASDSFTLNLSPSAPGVRAELIFSGIGISNNSSVLQSFLAGDGGQIIFNNTSTAGGATRIGGRGAIIFNDSSTAEAATLEAWGGDYFDEGAGGIVFNGASRGGVARVRVFAGYPSREPNGFVDISHHQSGVTVGSIEGDGNIFLGPNDLTVGANNIDTTFSGQIWNDGHRGSLAKIGSGVLTLQSSYTIGDTVGLILVSGSIINLEFTGSPDVIASLVVNGISQSPGLYGGPISGAPHVIPEFAGSGTVQVRPSTLANISTRALVETGDSVMIGGFIVQGPLSKEVVIRAIGPELTHYGVPNALANPKLGLHDATGALIASNDDWIHTIVGGIICCPQEDLIQEIGFAPTDSRESTIIADLEPGNYTAIVRGVNNTTGVALVEVDEWGLNSSVLGNISTRGLVQGGADVMIGGFIITGSGPKKVIVRAIGPELAQHGVPNPLADPILDLHNSTGGLIAVNDNWMDGPNVQDIINSGHAPTDPMESAIIATLPPGNYTAIVRGVSNTTGVALVEVYDLD